MARRKRKDEGQNPGWAPRTPRPSGHPADGPAPPRPPAAPPARVLCIDPCAQARSRAGAALETLGARVESAGTLLESRAALRAGKFDVAVVDAVLPDGSGLDLVRELTGGDSPVRCIVTSSRPELALAVEAMRCGAADFLAKPYAAADLADRVRAAIGHARRLREEHRRVDRLQRICKRLNTARREVSDQVDVLCHDLVNAYEDLADQMSQVSLASEFTSLIRQELDVESLLRTTLEYLLSKTGPTNAAVFLPTGHHDFNLGAYVNYDVPRDTADVLLDQLADIIAPRFEGETGVLHLATERELTDRLGPDASWLSGSGVVILSCRDHDECLAVMALFRDRGTPFPDDLLSQLALMRDIFAEQLGRVVRIHHRHIPDKDWPGFDVEDDRGLAA